MCARKLGRLKEVCKYFTVYIEQNILAFSHKAQ